jgi:hypothetical protein
MKQKCKQSLMSSTHLGSLDRLITYRFFKELGSIFNLSGACNCLCNFGENKMFLQSLAFLYTSYSCASNLCIFTDRQTKLELASLAFLNQRQSLCSLSLRFIDISKFIRSLSCTCLGSLGSMPMNTVVSVNCLDDQGVKRNTKI